MKKVFVMTLALCAMLACRKEVNDAPFVEPQPEMSVGNLLDYEYYDPSGNDLEGEIRIALLALENEQSLDYVSINRGIWLLETGINYLFPDYLYEHDSVQIESSSFIFQLNGENELAEVDVRDVLINVHTNILAEVTNEKKHVGTDFYVSAIENNTVVLEAKHVFLKGVTGTLTQTGKPIGTTADDRVAGYAYYCPYVPGNKARAAWRVAKENAEIALRSYWGVNSNINPKYYTNVTRYSTFFNPLIPTSYISKEHLLGNSNAYILAHQGPIPAAMCVTAQEQNSYAQAIYDDVNLITAKTKGILYLDVQRKNNTQGSGVVETFWHYELLTVGTNGWFAPNLPALTLSYL